MENELTKYEQQLVSLVQNKELGEIIKPLIKEIHLFDSFIAGTTHLDDKTVIDAAKEGDALSLRRENNKYDQNAILILNADEKKMGYVPEKDNIVFARLLDAGKILKAKISSIKKKGSFTQISIGIYLVDL